MIKTNVAIVFGGISNEHEISCLSAKSILQEINRDNYEITPIGITQTGEWVVFKDELDFSDQSKLPQIDDSLIEKFARAKPIQNPPLELIRADVAFPILHGAWGEDGTIQGLLELHGVPYVGSGVLASSIGMYKPLMKLLFRQAGLLVSNWQTFTQKNWEQDRSQVLKEIGALPYPLFIKPARGGSSLGISKVDQDAALSSAIEEALRHEVIVLVEEGITKAREIECGVLDGVERIVSLPAEIKVGAMHDFYDYQAKYLDDGAELIIPADLTSSQVKQIQELALKAFDSLGCEGLARVDFFLLDNGEVYLNEINTMPGFTPISMYPRTFAASGVSFAELIDRLLAEALSRKSGLR